MTEKSFQITLLVSLITHTIIFFNYPHLAILSEPKKSLRVQVVYFKKKSPDLLVAPQKQSSPKGEFLPRISSKIKNCQRVIQQAPLNKKESLGLDKSLHCLRQSKSTKPLFIKTDIVGKKKITLPPVEIAKINNPSYANYYQIVREKIRRAAYQNYTQAETGKVYLSFLISNTGILKKVQLVDEGSVPSRYLRETALASIQDASPFPPFPKELDYPQLSFNVIISFQIE